MATRVNIDQRPRVMLFLGGTILMASLMYGSQSFIKHTAQFQGEVKRRVIQQRGTYNSLTYLGDCVKSRPCVAAYFMTWTGSTPINELALYPTGLLWGAVMLLAGTAWKPELSMLRATRMSSWAQFNLPQKSAMPPRAR
jgi:hypothetical protein